MARTPDRPATAHELRQDFAERAHASSQDLRAQPQRVGQRRRLLQARAAGDGRASVVAREHERGQVPARVHRSPRTEIRHKARQEVIADAEGVETRE